jgi:hypothetical protein
LGLERKANLERMDDRDRLANSPPGAASFRPMVFTSSPIRRTTRTNGRTKRLFTKAGELWFCIAGIWRSDKDVGEAFTMLTMPLGPDIAPYHDRQIAILDRADWAVARSDGVSESDFKAAPLRRPHGPTDGLTAWFACV